MTMFDLDHWQEIWAALSKNRLRTFLTAFGVFWGIFLLVLLLGAGNGLANGVNAGFAGTATNSFFCWGMRTSKPYAGLQAGREIRIMVESEHVSDEETVWLSKDIARRIENELEYPGQIKVTVIRETRAVDYAR